MKRRTFLSGLALGGVAASLPPWIARAFEDGEACDPDGPARPNSGRSADARKAGQKVVFDAWRRARANHRPLLVLVIPEPPRREPRGQVMGALLQHGTDAQLALLGLAEVICARLEDLDGLVCHGLTEETWFVRIDPGPAPLEAVGVRVPTPEGAVWPRTNENVEAWIASAHQALETLLSPAWEKTLKEDPAPRPELETRLASEVRERLVTGTPPGSRWARSSGCGISIEGMRSAMIDCGMGHVPEKARRFLHFSSERW